MVAAAWAVGTGLLLAGTGRIQDLGDGMRACVAMESLPPCTHRRTLCRILAGLEVTSKTAVVLLVHKRVDIGWRLHRQVGLGKCKSYVYHTSSHTFPTQVPH